MALVDLRHITPSTTMGLWRMDESPAELCALFPHLKHIEMPYKHEARQKEFLAVRALLYVMTGRDDLLIDHLPSGKPIVDGYHISISHTRGYAAVLLSTSEQVAVDIEYRSDRVGRIAHKFIRPDEPAASIDDMLLLWSAKETLYKLHSDDDLQYFEMRALQKDSRQLLLENMKRHVVVAIHYEQTADYVLTYATSPIFPYHQ